LQERRRRAALASRWDGLAGRLRGAVSAATRVRREEPLAVRTTLRVGGAARLYAEPADAADLRALLRAAKAEGLAVHLLGRGSNLIVPDEGVDGLVLCLARDFWSRFEPQADGSILVGAGLRLKRLCGLAAAAGFRGFEFLEGIPGSVGGALRMNAGAMGGWMFDVVEAVELMTPDGETRTLRREEMHVAYRHCAELREAAALSARLRPGAGAAGIPAEITEEPGSGARRAAESGPPLLSGADPAAGSRGPGAIERQIDVYRRRRHESQPREPSAGCIFKNPQGRSAGRLIDESGLKGERVGGAEVSAVHANFIVNRGGATGADVLELIRRIRARVRERTGVDLEPEALLYGRLWEDVL
ncbi:MAG: FAD-binding protein, partial [Opitutaceae bacterium]